MADDAGTGGFTADEVCRQAVGNAGALALALQAYARHLGQQPEDAARFVGRLVAPSWDEVPGGEARVVARYAALNAIAAGADLRRLEGDAARAEASVAGWPSEEDLAASGLGQEEADAVWAYLGPVAERLGLRFSLRRDRDEVVLGFEQEGRANP